MLPKLLTKLPGPKAKKIINRDERIMSPSYTRDYPLVISKGEGCMVTDPDGNVFLDCAAGIAVCATGHSHPKVVQAIKDQADQYLHMSGTDFYYEPQVNLAEKIAKHAPFKGPAKLFFTNSGAESIEAAMKLSRFHTKRSDIIAFYGAFHGRTIGAMSLCASKVVQKQHFGPYVPGIHHIDYNSMEALDHLENVMFTKTLDPKNVAAIFCEPIQGEGGYIVPDDAFLRRVREICDRHGIMLVFDEVQSGFGRTGKFFAAEHSGVEPDIITMAKGIASGMTLGGILTKAKVMNWPYGAHASTYGGNPVACAAGIATIDMLEDSLIDNAAKIGAKVKRWIKGWPKKHSIVEDVRGHGLMLGIEISTADLRNEIVLEAFNRGLLILGCGPKAVRFCPPLVINEKQAKWAMDTLEKVIVQAAKKAPKKKVAKKPAKKTAKKKKA